jgi:Fe-Mn family superoxide dismutase
MTTSVTRRVLFGLAAGSLGTLVGYRPDAGAVPRNLDLPTRSGRAQEALSGPITLPPLNYPTDSLAPHIDQLTMEIHHGKHHQAYIDNLNKIVVENPDIAELLVEEVLVDLTMIPEGVRQGVRNNLGGHVNHAMFWNLMGPSGDDPSPELLAAIDRDFGSLDEMKAAMKDAGLKRFGSGWTWLVSNAGALSVVSTPNQDNPIMDGLGHPLIGIDVWEHAYYLTYQNRRADYLDAWWNVIDWHNVNRDFGAMATFGAPTR